MERVQAQASKLGKLLFEPKTADAYKTVLALTWQIIKETGLLLWLLICSGFIVGAWIGDNALRTGRNLRAWVDSQSQPQAEVEPAEKMAATGKALLEASQTGANYLLNQAREQLGLEKVAVVKPAKKTAAASVSKSKVVAQSKPAEVKEPVVETQKKPIGTVPSDQV
ncbi:MAG: hypothetical protein AAF152_02730 [Cyanobacteria bacterium P01_A01_bin.114]